MIFIAFHINMLSNFSQGQMSALKYQFLYEVKHLEHFFLVDDEGGSWECLCKAIEM